MEPDDFRDDDEAPEGEERELLQQDLTDVQVLKELLGPRGIKGTVFFCPDCDEDHYLGWDLLAGNLRELLNEGESPVHEPAYDPDPNEYVSWDYARGFLDGYESFEEEEVDSLTAQIISGLRGRGWSFSEAAAFLEELGLGLPVEIDEPPSVDR